jgi:hypothetical protein
MLRTCWLGIVLPLAFWPAFVGPAALGQETLSRQSSVSQAVESSQRLQVFVLAGQSNMEGQAVVDLAGKDYNEGRGTLVEVMQRPDLHERLQHLRDADGNWTVRNDVWIRYQRENRPLLAGPAGIGYAVYGGTHHFGPELQFAHVIGDYLDAPVLLIKTAWGGKSLYQDFRPPRSGGEPGRYYALMLQQIQAALAGLAADFPELKVEGYDIAGFVWYHGWNDGVDPQRAVPEYEQNLVNLILDVRDALQVPDLPVVIGELTGPWHDAPGAWQQLRAAQAAVAQREELGGNVLCVPTRDFVRAPEDSPNPSHGHHEFGNAETYFLVGDALGRGMQGLLEKRQPAERQRDTTTHARTRRLTPEGDADKQASGNAKREEPRPTQPEQRVTQELEGWQVLVDARLLAGDQAALGQRALRFLEGKLADIKVVVPTQRVEQLQRVRIVLDLECGGLGPMQYHPSAGWLKAHGYPAELAKCVHIPRAADLATSRNVREQPWAILHELAHAFHDQVLDFENERVMAVFERYRRNGRGEQALLFNGERVKHYGLTDQKEFFAEMTESYFGSNDFFPFNRAELKHAEPEIYELMVEIWEP